MKSRKAQGLPISTIIIAALGILVLVVLAAIFSGQIGKFSIAANACPGRCYKADIPTGGEGYYSANTCNPEFERNLGRGYIPQNMPTGADPSAWRCDQCCITT